MQPKTLNYVIMNPGTDISLDLFEAERYSAAVVVQPLIGNLVYYSNHGRYEPRIASRWERTAPNVWKFYLRDGFRCENGESINAASFKRSLERMLIAVNKKGAPPILSRMNGYQTLVEKGGELEGLTASGNELTFTFDRPIRAGLVEVLSFAPFGFICEENLNRDGTWKDKTRFISSGPYKIASVELGKEYLLELREDWKPMADPLAPEFVKIIHAIPEKNDLRKRLIIDSTTAVEGVESFTSSFRLVPEYLNSVLLGNIEHGLFRDISVRRKFKAALERARLDLPEVFKNHIRANAFYSGHAASAATELSAESVCQIAAPIDPIVIEGKEPTDISYKYYTWLTLKKALDACKVPYKFQNNAASWEHARSKKYDIRMRSTSVGGEPEAWGIDVLFCSLIGPGLPDPSGRVCELIEIYENDHIGETELGKKFLSYVEDDAAIIPISHNGGQLYLGNDIVTGSLNPTLNVMRFDQLQVR